MLKPSKEFTKKQIHEGLLAHHRGICRANKLNPDDMMIRYPSDKPGRWLDLKTGKYIIKKEETRESKENKHWLSNKKQLKTHVENFRYGLNKLKKALNKGDIISACRYSFSLGAISNGILTHKEEYNLSPSKTVKQFYDPFEKTLEGK